jgi:hypothetical protein
MLRALAIVIEVIILAAIIFSLLWAVRLILFDLVLKPKYKGIITLLLAAVGAASVIFFISHLISFYPTL